MKIKFIIIFLLCSFVYSQNEDSLSIPPIASDTLTNITDTLSQNKKYDVDDVVFASSSDSLFFDIRSKKMFVYGSGQLKYKQTELKSGLINVDFKSNDLEAFGVKDTADTAGIKLMDTPVLTEAGETYNGSSIKYNFKTQRGFISVAKNDKGDSRYEGAKVKKVSKDTYFIEDGIYTTCETDPPHTHFYADQMKVIQNDKVIAKWVFMFIAGVPVPIPIPFAVFPTEAGRRSGVIVPTYGDDANLGVYFRNFGYYFALSDYYDLALTGDFYTKGGLGIHSRVRYKKRYEFDGNVSFNYSNTTFGEEGDPDRRETKDWNVSVYHNQKLNPTTSLDLNLRYQSRNYSSNNSTNYNELLSKNIVSNATFRKRWDESGNSLTINYSRNQNLENGDITHDVPNITFNKKLVYPFKRETTTNTRDQVWYEYINYSYSAKARNRRQIRDGKLDVRNGAIHNINLSASPIVGFFSISPKIRYEEKWYPNRIKQEYLIIEEENEEGIIERRDTVIESEIDELNFVREFDFGVSASTKLYGVWQPNMFSVEAFRHTLSPSISYNYRPDFSEDFWGYYDSYTDGNGNEIKYDKFSKGIFGRTSSGESQRLNFSLGNIFEIKTVKDPTDTTSQQKKIQLLNLTASSGYDFTKDSLNLDNLRLSYRTQISDLLNLSGSSTFTFYDHQNGRFVNDFLASKGKGLFRMTNFSFSASTTLSGEKLKGETRTGQRQQNQLQNNEDDGLGQVQRTDYISELERQESDFTIPWSLSLDFNYSISKNDPTRILRTANIGFNLGVNLTKNWKVTLRGSYDIENDEISAPSVTMYRDLGCWEINLSWNPIGQFRGYRFNIRMKAPELQDIKVDKSGGLYSGRR